MKIQLFALTVIVGLAVAVGLLLRDDPAGGQPAPAVLQAQAIELVDGKGQVRAQLNVSGDEVVFRLRDKNGVIRTKLGADESGSGLLLNDNNTEPGVHILATRRRTSLTLKRRGNRRVLRP